MITIFLNNDHQMELDSFGNIKLADGIDACAIDVQSRILLNQGENPYNLEEGIAYNDNVFGKFGGEDYIKSVYKKEILKADDINSVEELEITRTDRGIEIKAKINTDYGVTEV